MLAFASLGSETSGLQSSCLNTVIVWAFALSSEVPSDWGRTICGESCRELWVGMLFALAVVPTLSTTAGSQGWIACPSKWRASPQRVQALPHIHHEGGSIQVLCVSRKRDLFPATWSPTGVNYQNISTAVPLFSLAGRVPSSVESTFQKPMHSAAASIPMHSAVTSICQDPDNASKTVVLLEKSDISATETAPHIATLRDVLVAKKQELFVRTDVKRNLKKLVEAYSTEENDCTKVVWTSMEPARTSWQMAR